MPRTEVAEVKRGSNKYRVVFERDESGAWLARVPSIRGCHTHGRTLEQARRRIREALSLWVDDADDAELTEEIRLPPELKAALRQSREARKRADRARAKARAATAATARVLLTDFDVSMRDAGELLGLSHQRVQQLARD